MEEDYVSFETAKLLKENGFDETTYRNYSATGDDSYYNFTGPADGIPCPTIQMARKWLMYKKGFYVAVVPACYEKVLVVEIYKFEFGEWTPLSEDDTSLVYTGSKSIFYKEYEKPEEAYDELIKYCLEKLVK